MSKATQTEKAIFRNLLVEEDAFIDYILLLGSEFNKSFDEYLNITDKELLLSNLRAGLTENFYDHVFGAVEERWLSIIDVIDKKPHSTCNSIW